MESWWASILSQCRYLPRSPVPERVTPERSTHPVLFLIMFLPMGISNGYVVVTLAYLLSAAGIGTVAIAALGAWSLVPCGSTCTATSARKARTAATANQLGEGRRSGGVYEFLQVKNIRIRIR